MEGRREGWRDGERERAGETVRGRKGSKNEAKEGLQPNNTLPVQHYLFDLLR